MKTLKIFVLVACLFLGITTSVLAQLSSLKLDVENKPVFGTDFLDANANIGYVCSGVSVYKTTNGGSSYVKQVTGLSGGQILWDVEFHDANTGYAVGNLAVVIKTTNGGTTWTFHGVAWTDDFLSLEVLSANEVTVVGSEGAVWKTINGGNNWINCSIAIIDPFFDVTFVNGKGFIPGQQNGHSVWKTTNSGVNWINADIQNFAGYCASNNGSHVYLGGRERSTGKLMLAKSTNEGANWTTVQIDKPGQFRAIDFTDANTGFAAANVWVNDKLKGYIYKTTDAGNTWIELADVINTKVYDIKCSPLKFYITGDSGMVYSGDITVGVTSIGTTIPDAYTLSQNYPNPFNPTTNINFSIPKSGVVKIAVYDMSGKEIAVLLNETKSAGNYMVDFNASNLASGTYFYRIETNGFVQTKKMTLVK